ncbi:hypothetical protein SteCoe_26608 [Stentor coeruleus]|uniref:AMP-dependent synthetase/ligase domain-containing protein n=1 Tax=Stentor coeruleus TaxID=5963 RepID=A0A1R2BCF2_9CILI|nr:hypothetical protein SteCoe_26608 [Stentor coeruleus]
MGNSKIRSITYNVPTPESAQPGYTPIYRNKIMCFTNEFATYIELFLQISYKYPTRPFLGFNRSKGYKWITFEKTREKVHKYVNFLQKIPVRKSDYGLSLIGILCKSSPEWIVFDLACMSLSYTIVPLHEHRGLDESVSIMNIVKISVLCCDAGKLSSIFKLKKEGKLPDLETIIVMGHPNEEDIIAGEQISTMYYLKNAKPAEICISYPESDSIYSLSTTSGTTGPSQIIQVTHKNLMSAIIGTANNGYDITIEDAYFSYFPLSIPMERTLLYTSSKFGTRVGLSSGNISLFLNEIQYIKPSIIVAVPLFLEEIYSNIILEFNKLTGFKRKLLNRAIAKKQKNYEKDGTLIHSIYDSLIFKKARENLGGKIRIIITGISYIREEVVKMLKIFLSCPILQGYGIVEANTCNLASSIGDRTDGHVGGPMCSLEARLKIIPEYSHLYEGPVGELFLRGEILSHSTWNGREILDDEGWFATGDIFTFQPSNNSFVFIERKGNMLRVGDDYIPACYIEAIYRTSNFVSQIFIYVSDEGKLVGVVVPHEGFLISISDNDHNKYIELLYSDKIKNMVVEDLNAVARKFKLPLSMVLSKVYIETVPWTNDEVLTVTLKLKRWVLIKKYKELL